MYLGKPLATDRLLLRTLEATDASNTYLAWMRDPEVTRFLESRFSVPKSLYDLIDFIDSINASPDSLLLGIFLRKEDRHIGNIKVGPVVARHARTEIGYLIGDRVMWGKGYAAEAIREACRYGFEELGLAKITAGVYETNKSSATALLKAGFIHEATISSHVVCEGRRIASLIYGLDLTV
jgi:ribosomal-protein-alanine N-acetyltransferase